MTISTPAASAACNAAQLRELILDPVDGMRVPSISMAISWILTPLFYLLALRSAATASKWETLTYHRFMPSIAYLECSRCQARISAESPQTLCPQCGGKLLVYGELHARAATARTSEEPEKDHRGVTLPARHRAGGIITPQ